MKLVQQIAARTLTFIFLLVFSLQMAMSATPSKPILQVGTEGTFKPFNYFQGPDLTGFEVELGNAMAESMNVNFEWNTIQFDQLIKRLIAPGRGSKKIDIIFSSLAITPERKKKVLFSNPHFCTGAVLISAQPKLTSISHMQGKTVGVGAGTTYLMQARKLKKLKGIQVLNSGMEGAELLKAGKIDFWIEDLFATAEYIKKNPSSNLHIGDRIFEETVAIAVRPDQKELIGKINVALAKTMADGTYLKLAQKYFGHDVRCTSED